MSDDIGGYIGYIKRGFTTDNISILNNLSCDNNVDISGKLTVFGRSVLNDTTINGNLEVSGTIISTGTSNSLWTQLGNDIYNNNTGNVGIGTPSPSYNLDVSGSIRTSKELYIGLPDTSSIIYIGNGDSGTNNYNNSIIETRTYGGTQKTEMLLFKGYKTTGVNGPDRIRLRGGAIAFDTYPTDLSSNPTSIQRQNENIRMYIDNSGNVGIGTTTPSFKLDISGDMNINGNMFIRNITNADTQLSLANTNGREYIIGSSTSTSSLGTGAFYILDLSAGNSTSSVRFLVNSAGNVGIGTTDTGTYKLSVVGSAAKSSGGSTWDTLSDMRVKENIIDANLKQCYDNIKKLPLRRFRWANDNMDTNDKNILGFIAQEVKEIYPKSVNIQKKTIIKDGKEIIIDDFHFLNDDQIIKSMNGAIKYLINKKENMENDISYLEKQLYELKSKLSNN